MSLFLGLAERTLGVARPVRSQLGRALRAGRAEAPAADGPQPQGESATTQQELAAHAQALRTPSQPTPSAADEERRGATQDQGSLVIVAAPATVVVPAAGVDAPAAAPDPAAPLVITRPPHRAPPTPPSRRAATAASLHRAAPDKPWPDPAPVVPDALWPGRPAPLPPRRADSIAPRSERTSREAGAAAQAPTEVHVSIGRVELTALTPATAPRAAAKPRDSGRSLADYLRGSRGPS